MTMKKMFLAGIAFLATLSLSAQVETLWDVRIGANVSQFSEGSDKMKLGVKAGAGFEIGFSKLFALRPGLFYSLKGASTDGSFAIGGSNALHLSYLEVPVLAAFRFGITPGFTLAINAGPYAALRLNNPDKAPTARRGDFGVDCGLDFIFGKFVFGPEVQYGLTKVLPEIGARNINYSLTFGYRF